jgi:hypothetical protein
MLFGCRELHVYTDHKNHTFNALQTERVLRWWLFLEEDGPMFHYIKGSENRVADTLSRLPFSERQYTDKNIFPENPADVRRQLRVDSFFSMVTDNPDLLDCFVHLPDQQGVPFQMDYHKIAEAQLQDAALLQQAQSQPQRVQQRLLAAGTQLYCYIATPCGPWKIYLPTNLLQDTVRWYHLALG